jgi:hypothetical protein
MTLQAGPLTMDFDRSSGWLRRVRLGHREVLRAVCPAVRDRFWNTLANHISHFSIESGAASFRLAFDAACRAGAIDFAFHSEIIGAADGTVMYRFKGEPRSTFLRNRIGLCVLHPIDGCAGHDCTIEHTDGTTETSRFPAEIWPHQPFHDVRAITHEVAPGVRLEVRCEGEVFETEDQRNWTDASYKTYSTPLALPFPVEVGPGTAIRQVVTLRLLGVPTPTVSQPSAGPIVAPGGRLLDRLPRLGFGIAMQPADMVAIERLRGLRPDHLRVDLTATEDPTADRLQSATAQADALGTVLEAAILLDDDPERDLHHLAEIIQKIRPPVGSWLICRGLIGVAGSEELALARHHLGDFNAATRFGVGTNLYFTQWNRTRPPLGEAEFVGFSVNPQVHAFDDGSLVETLDGQSAVAENAVRLAEGRAVAVTPITLRPRFDPNGGDGYDPDPRQRTLFAAAWTLGSLRRLASAGVASVTYFETIGSRGLMDGATVFPVYHVFADLADLTGWTVDTSVCNRLLEVEGLLFRNGDRHVALVANLTPQVHEVSLPFVTGPVHVRYLDETTADVASCNPAAFRAAPGTLTYGGHLRLGPYAVARIE